MTEPLSPDAWPPQPKPLEAQWPPPENPFAAPQTPWPPGVWIGAGPPRRKSVAEMFVIGLAIAAGAVGLLFVGFAVLVAISFNNSGSNK